MNIVSLFSRCVLNQFMCSGFISFIIIICYAENSRDTITMNFDCSIYLTTKKTITVMTRLKEFFASPISILFLPCYNSEIRYAMNANERRGNMLMYCNWYPCIVSAICQLIGKLSNKNDWNWKRISENDEKNKIMKRKLEWHRRRLSKLMLVGWWWFSWIPR